MADNIDISHLHFACQDNDFKGIQYLHQIFVKGQLNKTNKYWDEYHDAFIYCCNFGHEDIAKWLYSIGIDIHYNNDIAFVKSIEMNNINIAKWLYSLGGINIHAHDNVAFGYSCQMGRIDTAKWLYSLDPEYISTNTHNVAFHVASINGYGEIIKWLHSLGNITQNNINSEFRRNCAYSERYELAQLFCQIGANIHYDNDEPLRTAICYKNTKLVKWLLTQDKFDNALVTAIMHMDISLNYFAFRLGYRPTTILTKMYYRKYLYRKLKCICTIIGKLWKQHTDVCERRYRFNGPGYLEVYVDFNLHSNKKI